MNEYALHQYSLKAGIKKFGERGLQGAYKEVEQLHLRNAFSPVKFDELTEEERKKTIGSLIFLKEKEDGEIKGSARA